MTPFSLHLPERSLAIDLLRRGAVIWLIVHLTVGVFVKLSSGMPRRDLLNLGVETSIALVLLAGGLGLLEARRRNEHRFLENLGVSQVVIVLLSMIPAVAAELALGIASPR